MHCSRKLASLLIFCLMFVFILDLYIVQWFWLLFLIWNIFIFLSWDRRSWCFFSDRSALNVEQSVVIQSDCVVIQSGCVAIQSGCVAIQTGCVAIQSGCVAIQSGCVAIQSDCVVCYLSSHGDDSASVSLASGVNYHRFRTRTKGMRL